MSTPTEPTPEDLAPLRLEAARIQLQKICDDQGWSVRLLDRVTGYGSQLVVRKPRPHGFGTKITPEYVRTTGKTELEAYLNMLGKLGART